MQIVFPLWFSDWTSTKQTPWLPVVVSLWKRGPQDAKYYLWCGWAQSVQCFGNKDLQHHGKHKNLLHVRNPCSYVFICFCFFSTNHSCLLQTCSFLKTFAPTCFYSHGTQYACCLTSLQAVTYVSSDMSFFIVLSLLCFPPSFLFFSASLSSLGDL